MPDGQLKPLTRHQPSTIVENGDQGASNTIGFIARQWASPSVKEQEYQKKIAAENRVEQGLKTRLKKTPALSWSPPACSCQEDPMDLGLFLSRLKTHMFSISCMVFQDVWNLDLKRVQDCCIHVFSPDGRLIPFCMYNLTDAKGRSLYRTGTAGAEDELSATTNDQTPFCAPKGPVRVSYKGHALLGTTKIETVGADSISALIGQSFI